MGKRKKKKKGRKSKEHQRLPLAMEYYQLPFFLIGGEMLKQGYDGLQPHPLRQSFWNLVPPGVYGPEKGRSLVESYLVRLEQELRAVISRHSLAYWLHLYRRTGPGVTGRNDSPAPVCNVRATFEAAIQKLSLNTPCDRIANSADISPEQIIGGLLLATPFKRSLDSL